MSATDIYLCPNTPRGPTDIILRIVAPCLASGATSPAASAGGGVVGTWGVPAPVKRIERFGSVEGVTTESGVAAGTATFPAPVAVRSARVVVPNVERAARRRREQELLCVV